MNPADLVSAPTSRINLVPGDSPSGVRIAQPTGSRITYSHPAHPGKAFHAMGFLDLIAQTWPGNDVAFRRDSIIERYISFSDKLLMELFLGNRPLDKIVNSEFKILVYFS